MSCFFPNFLETNIYFRGGGGSNFFSSHFMFFWLFPTLFFRKTILSYFIFSILFSTFLENEIFQGGGCNKNVCGVSFWTCWREISGDRGALLLVFVNKKWGHVVCLFSGGGVYSYITERSVRWYYGFSIAAAAAAAASASARRPWRREHSNSINIQPISCYMRVDTPLRYFAIEIWYPPMTRTTAFAAKRHSCPPNLQNAISP